MDQLTTRRLELRRWSEEDRTGFSELASDPRVVRFIGDGSAWSPERTDDVFERQLRHWAQHGFGWRAAILRATDEWAGFVGLNHVGPEATEVTGDEVEIGWWLRPELWGRGLATEGARALHDEAFEQAALDRIIGRHRPENVASGRIMKTLGMQVERDAVGRHGEIVRICALERAVWERRDLSGV